MTRGGARGQRPPRERAEERHAGDARGFVAQRRAARARAPAAARRHGGARSDLLAVTTGMPRVKRAADQRARRLDAAERFDDDVGRLGEEIVGTRGQAKAAAGAAGLPGRGPARRQSSTGRLSAGGCERARRGEGGADVTQAEQADADWRCVASAGGAGEAAGVSAGAWRSSSARATCSTHRRAHGGAVLVARRRARATSNRQAEAAPGAEMGARNFVRPERSSRLYLSRLSGRK